MTEMVMLAEFTIMERIGIWIILVGLPLLAGYFVWCIEERKDKKGNGRK